MNIKQFVGNQIGHHLTVFGAIHGDEVCGPITILKLIHRLESGDLRLKSGQLTLVAICNPKAYQQQKRYCEKNLNRIFQYHAQPSCYEEQLANELLSTLHRGDYLLDLHSMPENGTPLVFQDDDDESVRRFAEAQQLPYILTGWPELYSKNGVLQNFTTADYAKLIGAIPITVECGQHNDPKSVDIANQCLLNTLCYLDMLDIPWCRLNHSIVIQSIRMKSIVYKNKSGHLFRLWKHFDKVVRGDVLVQYDDGEKIFAEEDSYIILPYYNASIGEEWFYLGEHVVQ